jgi:hypothetical protein
VVLAFLASVAMLWEPIRRARLRWDYFVSYQRSNEEIARRIADGLSRKHYKVWIDLVEISDEDKRHKLFRNAIGRGIQRSAVAILLTSRAYCDSPYCREEAERFLEILADDLGRLVEIRLEPNELRQRMDIPVNVRCIERGCAQLEREGALDELVADILRLAPARTARN